jgi:hypothetical protein
MKVLRFILFLAVAALLAPTTSWAAPGDGLASTAHDFSGKSVTGGNGETFTTGLCTFCHTPHKALSTLLLWNHTLSSNNFSWDVPATTAGTKFATFKGDTYKGPTAKCLSCHDGSVAIGDVAWFGEGKPAAPLDTTKHGEGDTFNVGFGGNMAGNHPVAMPYPYLQAKNTYNGTTTGDGAVLNEWQNTPLANIRIFNDDGAGNITAGAIAAKTGIECSSCHDPHNKAAVDDLFLRGTLGGNTTDYICLKCHIK